jgi:hypothetical protein
VRVARLSNLRIFRIFIRTCQHELTEPRHCHARPRHSVGRHWTHANAKPRLVLTESRTRFLFSSECVRVRVRFAVAIMSSNAQCYVARKLRKCRFRTVPRDFQNGLFKLRLSCSRTCVSVRAMVTSALHCRHGSSAPCRGQHRIVTRLAQSRNSRIF